MAHDVFDEDEEMNRCAEAIDIRQGAVFARTCAPANPLVLYIRGAAPRRACAAAAAGAAGGGGGSAASSPGGRR